MAADLHCHTKISDGSVGIEELIKLALNSGMSAIAITDHDTFAGAIRGRVIGKRYGIDVLPGAEICAFDRERGRPVHLLCYLCDRPERLETVLHNTNISRKMTNNKIAVKIHARYPFCTELLSKHVAGSANLFKQHILHALMDAGHTDRVYGDLYNELFAPEGELAELLPEYPEVIKTLELIKSAGGVAVLAHPYTYDSLDLIQELVEKGLDGIEVWYPGNDEKQTETLIEIADNYNLLKTGGTDFHGMYSRNPITVGAVSAPDTEVRKLYQCKAAMKQQASV